jgi:hypothetical protein
LPTIRFLIVATHRKNRHAAMIRFLIIGMCSRSFEPTTIKNRSVVRPRRALPSGTGRIASYPAGAARRAVPARSAAPHGAAA